jgi:hypothetical protein
MVDFENKFMNEFPVGTSDENKISVINKFVHTIKKLCEIGVCYESSENNTQKIEFKEPGIYYINDKFDIQKIEHDEMINIMLEKRKHHDNSKNPESDSIKELEMLSTQKYKLIIVMDYVQDNVLMWYFGFWK